MPSNSKPDSDPIPPSNHLWRAIPERPDIRIQHLQPNQKHLFLFQIHSKRLIDRNEARPRIFISIFVQWMAVSDRYPARVYTFLTAAGAVG
jgi:hypothetical protein